MHSGTCCPCCKVWLGFAVAMLLLHPDTLHGSHHRLHVTHLLWAAWNAGVQRSPCVSCRCQGGAGGACRPPRSAGAAAGLPARHRHLAAPGLQAQTVIAFKQNHLHCRHVRGSSSCIGLLSNTLNAPADVAAWFCTEYLASWVSFVVDCPFCEKQSDFTAQGPARVHTGAE